MRRFFSSSPVSARSDFPWFSLSVCYFFIRFFAFFFRGVERVSGEISRETRKEETFFFLENFDRNILIAFRSFAFRRRKSSHTHTSLALNPSQLLRHTHSILIRMKYLFWFSVLFRKQCNFFPSDNGAEFARVYRFFHIFLEHVQNFSLFDTCESCLVRDGTAHKKSRAFALHNVADFRLHNSHAQVNNFSCYHNSLCQACDKFPLCCYSTFRLSARTEREGEKETMMSCFSAMCRPPPPNGVSFLPDAHMTIFVYHIMQVPLAIPDSQSSHIMWVDNSMLHVSSLFSFALQQ